MDEETRERCLEPFYSTKGEQGTGMGLAMVYGVMQRHDGSIEIESERGKGTTMRLLFPATGMEEETLPCHAEGVAPYEGPSLRILCVDDEARVREVLHELLRADGHHVETANGGEDGVAAFQRAYEQGHPFDVVITDLGMPKVDGYEVARAIKRLSPSTPVILLTGWGYKLRTEGNVPIEVDEVLSKPVEMRKMREALARVVYHDPSMG
jgi:CheY-like chemotaxis protein